MTGHDTELPDWYDDEEFKPLFWMRQLMNSLPVWREFDEELADVLSGGLMVIEREMGEFFRERDINRGRILISTAYELLNDLVAVAREKNENFSLSEDLPEDSSEFMYKVAGMIIHMLIIGLEKETKKAQAERN